MNPSALNLDYYRFIYQHIVDNGYSPSIDELARHFEVAKYTAQHHVQRLEEAGYIKRAYGLKRTIVPLKGRV